MRKTSFGIALVALAVALTGCGRKPLGGDPAITTSTMTAMPAPAPSDYLQDARPYYVGPFDKLKVDVFGVEDLQRDVQVNSGGDFSFPLVGTVTASGKRPEEIAADVAGRLRGRYVRNPQVTVNVEEANQQITVDGQVTRPGLYPVVGRMTLMQAVATTSGASEFANLSDVVIFRTVNGKRYAGLYDLKAIRRGAYADPDVYAHDVVMVGDSKARRLFRDLLQAAPLLTTPLIILAQN